MYRNFKFLKTTKGRGFFDLFCSMMFLITVSSDNGGIWGWIFFGVLAFCGTAFLMVGCLCKGVDPAGEDINSAEAAKSAVNASSKMMAGSQEPLMTA